MYDVIVVGARCAGAPTAMLLARAGHRVLLMDRAHFPSDQPMSTHLVWQSGGARLQRWGLLTPVVNSGCPPLSTVKADLGPLVLSGRPPGVDAVADAHAPRRTVLDGILVEAADEAGAELREGCTVQSLTWEDGRVCGMTGRTEGGSTFAERARIVVGADGMHSRVAREVQAHEHDARPLGEGTWFSYWSDIDVEGIVLYLRDRRLVYGWGTNDGLTLVGVDWAAHDYEAVRHDVEGNFWAEVEQAAPELAQRLRSGRRGCRWIAGPPCPNLLRKPWGPGWALVGDAGYLKDFGTAQGISDAFRDAEWLTAAIDEGLTGTRPLDEALADYERARDQAVMPMYEFTAQFTQLAPPPPETVRLFAAMHGNQQAIDRFFGVFAGSIPVEDFFGPDNVEAILAAAT
jgi:2-polyprenyl-6-methoxyphenol hydroxylase-like FAD-dependent oxidoreductase